MNLHILIPSYNEIENIETLIHQIFSILPQSQIWILDDASTDGTTACVKKLISHFPHQQLKLEHHTQKEGLGKAYQRIFQKLSSLLDDQDIVIQMDADFSHPPSLIPSLIQNIEAGYDLVIASRYVKRGKIKNWNTLRRILSFVGNLYTRLFLKIPIKDCTSGYKAYRAFVLKKWGSSSLKALGYLFQIETNFIAYKQHYKIKEIPFCFEERKKRTF